MSTARRGPGVLVPHPPVAPDAPQTPLTETSVDTDVPTGVGSLLVA
ncbi:MAG TPA: hypothetical protein VKE95_18475 [Burkholderiales bacterium]|nr:hypothetical protein [Burkholderiales bacterium]